MTASFQAQHVIPGDVVYLGGARVIESVAVGAIGTRLTTSDGANWAFPNGQLVTVTEAEPRTGHA